MRHLSAALLLVGLLVGCHSTPEAHAPASSASEPAHAVGTRPGQVGQGTPLQAAPGRQLAAFAAGCFWGVEARFRAVPGVVATAVGYTGGRTRNPTYEEVCSHTTGHAEAVLVEFDPARVSYEKLLEAFWTGHDPTQLDRQGPDVGDQYRSAIFTFSPEQQAAARASMTAFQKRLTRPIATRIDPVAPFYAAEEYHQQFHEKTGTEACPSGKAPMTDAI
jgi:peptide-methionine (S)-S-oxide reductase